METEAPISNNITNLLSKETYLEIAKTVVFYSETQDKWGKGPILDINYIQSPKYFTFY